MDAEEAHLDGEIVRLVAPHPDYRLEPAVRFVRAVVGAMPSGGDGLIGKVLGEARLGELGGELFEDSVLFGDVAFQVETGYIGTALGAAESEGVS